jgi:hypothetical protein
MGMTRSITKVSQASLRRLWATDLSRDEIAVALKISRSSLDRLVTLSELPKKPRLSKSRRPGDPDEQTIAILTSRIQQQWSKKKMAARRVNKMKLPIQTSKIMIR